MTPARFQPKATGVQFLEPDAGVVQRGLDGEPREAGILLDAREALLLGGEDDPTVLHKGGGRVVQIGVDPEHMHWSLL